MTSLNHDWHTARAAQRTQVIADALDAQPMTRVELAEATGYRRRTVETYVERMYAAGEIRVVKWLRRELGRGPLVPVFAFGPGPDAIKPKPKTPAQLAKRMRAKVKADPLRRLEYLQKARIRETRRGRVKAKPDAWMAQFAGIFGNRQQEAA
jgi:hypothetical protein